MDLQHFGCTSPPSCLCNLSQAYTRASLAAVIGLQSEATAAGLAVNRFGHAVLTRQAAISYGGTAAALHSARRDANLSQTAIHGARDIADHAHTLFPCTALLGQRGLECGQLLARGWRQCQCREWIERPQAIVQVCVTRAFLALNHIKHPSPASPPGGQAICQLSKQVHQRQTTQSDHLVVPCLAEKQDRLASRISPICYLRG